jgi:hypothetical protein
VAHKVVGGGVTSFGKVFGTKKTGRKKEESSSVLLLLLLLLLLSRSGLEPGAFKLRVTTGFNLYI